MKLIRRRKQQTPAEKALTIASKVFRALAVVRLTRGALRGVRFAKRLPLIAALAAAAAFVIGKLRSGRADAPASPPPPAGPSASPPPAAPPA
jgi:hypothetical protein